MKVMIIDDDKIFTWMHSLVVKKCGMASEPLTFTDAQSAFNYISADTNYHSNYFVLLDINMPEMDGWQFLEKINNQTFKSRVQVAMVTSSTAPGDINKAKEFPQVIDYFSKPFTHEYCKRLKKLSLFE